MLHLGDITRIHGAGVPAVEVVIGGSPCQDLSVAGKRAGLDGERSGLFMDQIRVIKEMRDYDKRVNARTGADVRPRYMVWENVPGAFSSAGGEGFRAVLEETAHIAEKDAVIPRPEKGKWQTAGCIMGDGWSIAWRVLDAQFWGVPQRRRRIALVADFGGDTAPEILFERESVSGDSQESGEAREGTAGDAEKGVGTSVFVLANDFIEEYIEPILGEGTGSETLCLNDQGGAVMSVPRDMAGTLRAQEHGHQPVVIGFTNRGVSCEKAETLRAESHGAIPTVAGFKLGNSEKAHSIGWEEEKSPTLNAECGGNKPAICIQGNCIDRADTAGCNGKGWRDDDVSFTLNTIDRPAVYDARGNGDGTTAPTLTGDHQNRVTDYTALTFQNTGHGWWNESPVGATIRTPSGGDSTLANIVCAVDGRNGTGNPDTNGTYQAKSNRVPDYTAVCVGNGQMCNITMSETGNSLDCMHDQQAVMVSSNVRRLTPLECERLQGYPDGWTDIGEWVDSKGKKHESSDSARYKALGNSIALPPWRFVLGRLNAYLTEHTMASLFDGIGGFPLIWRELNGDGKCLWASEIEEFPIAVTKRRFNG